MPVYKVEVTTVDGGSIVEIYYVPGDSGELAAAKAIKQARKEFTGEQLRVSKVEELSGVVIES